MPPLIRKNCGSGVTVTYIANTGYLILELGQFLTNQVVSKSSCPVPTSWLSTTQRISGWRRQPPQESHRSPDQTYLRIKLEPLVLFNNVKSCCVKINLDQLESRFRNFCCWNLEKRYIWHYRAFQNQQTINKVEASDHILLECSVLFDQFWGIFENL